MLFYILTFLFFFMIRLSQYNLLHICINTSKLIVEYTETQNKIRTMIIDFMNHLNNAEMIDIDMDKCTNRTTFLTLKNFIKYISAFSKIILDEKNSPGLTHDEFIVFHCKTSSFIIADALERIKETLKIYIDEKKIPNIQKMTFGKLIHILCDKIKCKDEERKYYIDLFLVEFRNIIFHMDYIIENECIKYPARTKNNVLPIYDLTHKTKQNKTKQNKTKQNKTKQNKTNCFDQ